MLTPSDVMRQRLRRGKPATHFDAKWTAAPSGAAVVDEDAIKHLSAVNEIVRRHILRH